MTPDREERIQKEREERIREERIRLRALEIWREQGCPDGRAREHWGQAEREVDGEEGRGASDDQPPSLVSPGPDRNRDRKSTRLNSSHANISYAVFCLKKKKT